MRAAALFHPRAREGAQARDGVVCVFNFLRFVSLAAPVVCPCRLPLAPSCHFAGNDVMYIVQCTKYDRNPHAVFAAVFCL